jgi:hypothetical protein
MRPRVSSVRLDRQVLDRQHFRLLRALSGRGARSLLLRFFPMIARLLGACLLMALCVVIHAAGIAGALRRLRKRATSITTFYSSVLLFVLLAVWMILLHLAEIAVWAAAFVINGALPTFETALYFSAVTYTTTGYGDVVLAQGWRLHGGVEALTGILMCGWSTAFFYAIVTRLHEVRSSAMRS